MLRNFFNALSFRERLLLAVFIWALLLIWFLMSVRTFQDHLLSFRINQRILADNAATLGNQGAAEAELQRTRQGLDASRTFSAARLSERLDTLARETGLSFNITSPVTVDSDIFSYHTVRLAIRQARLERLMEFDERIKQESPYITLTQFQITANTRDPRLLDVTFELSSFELKDAALN
ncbi:MAG: hypothetical protein JJT96_03170 [Opitutales bacterium]|nr:hypothetical protein [Opitutales bacterium]